MKKVIFSVIFIFISTTVYSQTGPNDPGFEPSELIIKVINAPPSFGLQANVILSSMAFSGSVNSQKVYSNVYTNSSGTTQPITGGNHFFSNTNTEDWRIEHIEDGHPTIGELWIGYGLYRITIGNFTFYLDYLDSNYPYTGTNPDIYVEYDFNRPSNSPIIVKHFIPEYTVYPLANNVIRIWSSLFGIGQNPEATDFYLHGTIPIDPNQTEEKLFTQVVVDGNITVPTGKTFTVDRGAYPGLTQSLQDLGLKFDASTSLTVLGTLNARGKSIKKITFDRSGTTGNWGSIIFDGSSASNSILDNIEMKNGTEIQCLNGANVTIQNSTLDHNIQGIYIYNSAPLIKNNQIIEPRDNGIHGEASGLYIVVRDNIITKTENDTWSNYHNFEGIRFTNNTSSEVIHNDISGFYWGGYFGGGDNINFGTVANNINNRFLDNLYGFASGWGSTVLAGDINGIGGYNTAFNNSIKDVKSYQGSNLEARYNYWGGGQPNSYVDGTSTLIITNVLTTDPWGGAVAYKDNDDLYVYVSTSSVNTSVTNKINTSNNNNFSDIKMGIALEKQGKINEAVNHYKTMIKNDNNVRFALTKLVNFIHKYSRTDILSYLKSLSNNSKYSALITKLIADIYLQNNQFNDAINTYTKVISNHSKDFQGINSRFEKMFAYLHIKKDKTKAKQILSEIKSMNLTDDIWSMRIKTAEYFLGNYSAAMIANSNITLQKDNTEFNNNPEVYTLFDNYPNPFNPTTTISYSIPKGSFVTLTIYDVLGREVKTLVNKFQKKGKYNVTFNASGLTSGIYIYRISAKGGAGNFSAVKKLVLMK